jgi:GntR family transcriptional regulator, carbon starvation induced regulator
MHSLTKTETASMHTQGGEGTHQPIRKADSILEDMRLDLITGVLAPGERVKIQDLTERYKVSQTTIREVLPKLAAEGFVVEIAQRGYQVLPISLEDLDELTHIRLDLELPALIQSIAHGGPEWEVGILRAQHLMRVYAREYPDTDKVEHTRGWIAVHREYHASLIAGSPSIRRRHYCRNLFDQSSRYFWLAANSLSSSKANLEHHAELTDTILSGNEDLSVKMLRDHIEQAHDDIMCYMVKDTSIKHRMAPKE